MNRGSTGCTDAAYYHPDRLGDLLVRCWCEREYVRVPAAEVRQGLTKSCGLAGCVEDVWQAKEGA